MKLYKYVIGISVFTLMVAFTPKEKHRKITQPLAEHLGHVEWIKITRYHAVKDTDGSIIKGSIISDTDYIVGMQRMEDMKGVQRFTDSPELFKYDEYGDEIEHDKYHANGRLYSKTTHEYYPNGDIEEIIDSNLSTPAPVSQTPLIQIQKFIYSYDVNDNLLGSTEYINNNKNYWPNCKKTKNVYDESGHILEAFTFDKDTIHPLELTLFRYNDKGQKTEEDRSTRQVQRGIDDLIPTEKTTFAYDGKGRESYRATYRFHAWLVKDETTTFDTNGRTVDIRTYGRNNSVVGSQVKRFLKNLHMLLEDTYDANGMLTDYNISHFDTAKHLLDKAVFHINTYPDKRYMSSPTRINEPADTIMMQHIINDDHFNVVEDDKYSYDGKIQTSVTYQYKYDNTANWVDKLVTTNNKPDEIVEREIGYFKD